MPLSASWKAIIASTASFSIAMMGAVLVVKLVVHPLQRVYHGYQEQPMARSQKLALQPVSGFAQYISRLSS